jgi:hypothetical protein
VRTPTDISVWHGILRAAVVLFSDLYNGVLRGVISRAAGDAVLLLGLVGGLVTAVVADMAPAFVGARGARRVRHRVERTFGVAIIAFVVIQWVAHQLGH